MGVQIHPITGKEFGGFFEMKDGILVPVDVAVATAALRSVRGSDIVPLPAHFPPELPEPDKIPMSVEQAIAISSADGGKLYANSIGPGGGPPRCWFSQRAFYEVEWEADELREDMAVLSEICIQGPGNVGFGRSFTVGWKVELDLSFSLLKGALKGGAKFEYSESRTRTNFASFPVAEGRYGRAKFTPKMHHKNGWVTVDELQPTCNWLRVRSREWCPVYIPVPFHDEPDGYYSLDERDEPF